MLNLLHATRGVLPPSIYGRSIFYGRGIHSWIYPQVAFSIPQAFLSPLFSSLRPLFQDYRTIHPWIFYLTREFSSTRQVTGSTSDR